MSLVVTDVETTEGNTVKALPETNLSKNIPKLKQTGGSRAGLVLWTPLTGMIYFSNVTMKRGLDTQLVLPVATQRTGERHMIIYCPKL